MQWKEDMTARSRMSTGRSAYGIQTTIATNPTQTHKHVQPSVSDKLDPRTKIAHSKCITVELNWQGLTSHTTRLTDQF